MLFEAVHKLQPNPSLKAVALLAGAKVIATKKTPKTQTKKKQKQNKKNPKQIKTKQNQ